MCHAAHKKATPGIPPNRGKEKSKIGDSRGALALSERSACTSVLSDFHPLHASALIDLFILSSQGVLLNKRTESRGLDSCEVKRQKKQSIKGSSSGSVGILFFFSQLDPFIRL